MALFSPNARMTADLPIADFSAVTMSETIKIIGSQDPTLLEEMCVYCNNYFTPKNKPVFDFENVIANAPSGFLRLADNIAEYIASTPMTNVTANVVSTVSESVSVEFSSWKVMFSQDLALYKRARFL